MAVIVTPHRDAGPVAEKYHPWRELRARPHLTFLRRPLPAGLGAVLARRGDRTTIIIDTNLGRAARAVALTHELVHDEWGVPCDDPSMPEALRRDVRREEARVNREVARRLLPLDELAPFVERMVDLGEQVTAQLVAEEFDTTEHMAELSLALLASENRESA